MTFKQWVNSLPTANMMALAYTCGLPWKGNDTKRDCRTNLAAVLVKSVGAKDVFRDYNMADIKVSARPDVVAV